MYLVCLFVLFVKLQCQKGCCLCPCFDFSANHARISQNDNINDLQVNAEIAVAETKT